MSKAILVIDMPRYCNERPICVSYQTSAFSPREYWCVASENIGVDPHNKPKWCPLRLLPEKYDIETERNKPHDRDCNWEFESGYNVCIDEILSN